MHGVGVVAGNASERGAAFYCVSSTVTLVHCTVVGNRADNGGDFFLAATSP